MIIVLPGIAILSTEKGSANAASSAVIKARGGFIDNVFASSRHTEIVLLFCLVCSFSARYGSVDFKVLLWNYGCPCLFPWG
jgi:hypothetical protein